MYRDFSSNTARSYARDLPAPATWSDGVAKRVYDEMLPFGTLVDMFLIEPDPAPQSAEFVRAYGETPNVIAYRLWDVPGTAENAEAYLVRHIARARQYLGGIPYVRRSAQ
jgi:hypothetical protein